MCDVHAIAAEASALEAETEKFLDDALISDIQDTPLTTIESVLEERREAQERRERVDQRTKEMLEVEMAKQKHEKDVKALQEAISETQPPAAPPSAAPPKSKREGKKSAAAAAAPSAADDAESTATAAAAAELPFKLESASLRTRDANPYVLNLTEFMPETEASRQARDLKAENELLRKCLSDAKAGKKSNAFEGYLRGGRSTHTGL